MVMLSGVKEIYRIRLTIAAENVVSKVYVIVRAKIFPCIFLVPSSDKVVITARAIVGTAIN